MSYIKIYENSDFIKLIKPLCEGFSESINKKLDWEFWSKSIKALCDNGIAKGLIAFNDDNEVIGMLVFTFFPDLISGELNSTEICFYVVPKYRKSTIAIELLDTMINFSKVKFVKNINLTHFSCDERISSLYERKGFVLFEKNYTLRVD